jgi:cytoskeleton protein RodZ
VFEIGNSLREARLRQGLDFFEIEQSTKIRGKYLRALEDEQFEVLPAQTYVKGFLRSYADYLGLDGQLYVDEFNSRYVRGEFEEDEEARAFKPRVARPGRGSAFQSKAVLITLAAIAGLTIFVFVAWISGGPGNQNTALSVNAKPKTTKKAPPKPMANLVARGVNGGAYVVVYRGSRTGKPVYEGTLESGKGHRFIGHHIWVYVFAPANLRLKLNGRSRVVPGAGTGSRRWLEGTPKHVQLATAPA